MTVPYCPLLSVAGEYPLDPEVLDEKHMHLFRNRTEYFETAHMQQVIQHPAFVADPFAALQEHLKNTVGQHGSKERKKEGREYQ